MNTFMTADLLSGITDWPRTAIFELHVGLMAEPALASGEI